MSSSRVDPPAQSRRRALSTPAIVSLAAVAVGGGAYLLVPRMGPAYGDVGTGQGLRLTSSSVVVADGDTGSVTVQGDLPASGAPVSRCVQVRFTGPRRGRVDLRVDAGRQPADVVVRVERGGVQAAGPSGECRGFRPEAEVFRGMLAELASPGRAAGWTADPATGATYRVTFTPAGAAGTPVPVSALFLWSAVRPSGPASTPGG